MNKPRIFDCITFFDENLLTNSRFEILDDVVDFFIICESKYDHKGKEKPINFKLINHKFRNKVRHLIVDDVKSKELSGWEAERYQREKIFEYIEDARSEDYIMFSDSDEIPNPKKLKDFNMKKKYAIFLQNFYVYKFNILNKSETPWEGTKICKKKFLKSFTYLRKKVHAKNINKPFWKIFTQKNIELVENGGWHFNNIYTPEKIKKKIETFPHTEFNLKKFTNIENIKYKIDNMKDLFDRNYEFKKVNLDNTFPDYLVKNKLKFKDYIL